MSATTKVESKYLSLNEAVSSSENYEIVNVDNFCPTDRFERRKYIKNLRLSKPVMLYRVSFGGSVWTLNFVWKVLDEDSPERSTQNSRVVGKILKSLPKFSTRAMRREFINKYEKYVKAPRSLLRQLYHELTDTEEVSANKAQHEVNNRAMEILLNGNDTYLLFDMRTMRGRDVDTKFGTLLFF